jgi:acetolactate synthase-1/2/3 large subunit
MKGAQFIAESIHRHGVTHVFLVPAILRSTLVELEKLGVSRITTHSEAGAAYMADGYSRAGRRPAVAMAQSVGAANLAAGLQDAYLGHSAVVALTGRKAPMFQHRNAYQEIQHGPMYAAVTKYRATVDCAGQLPHILPQLFREATTGTPGPVHADLSGLSGEIVEQGDPGCNPLESPRHVLIPPDRPAADPAAVVEALALLGRAARPILIAGGGAVVSGAHSEVLTLAERLSLPVATSNDAKGILPENHPLAAGVVGSYSQQCGNRTVAAADLVFFVGCATGDQVTLDWTLPASGIPVIQLDINPLEIGRNYPQALGLTGDARTVLAQMNAMVQSPRPPGAWAGQIAGHVDEWRALVAPQRKSDAMPIRPERLCHEIEQALPDNAILVADTGYSCVWAGSMIGIEKPGQRFLRAAGSLGWAFPAALGAKCACPERPVLCFCGDGAFLYHLGELETARRWGIQTVTVVNNNSYFGQSIPGMVNAYAGAPGNPDQVVQFQNINYAEIAQDFGCIGIRVDSPADIGPALRRALLADRPVVVDVVTAHDAHPPAIWRPAN